MGKHTYKHPTPRHAAAAALAVLTALAGSADAGWEALSGNGRGCCADALGAVASSLESFEGIGSVSACRRQCETNSICTTIEYDKDTEVCRTFAAGTVSTVLLNYYDCTAFKRCQHFVSDAPTPSPTGMPMAEAPEQEGENRAADADEEESNFSVQGGNFDYLASFYAMHRPPFGIIAGRAGLVRTATGLTKISAAFKIGLSLDVDGSGLDDLAAATFAIRLHADVCGVGGGLTYQNPYICASQAGGRCSDIQVAAAARGGSPVEVRFDATVNTGANMESIVEMVWPVHVPELFRGQSRHSLSMIMYDPVSGAAMACADLEDDRLMDGLMYYINAQAVPFVPVVTESHLTRTERGATELHMAMLNLPSDRTFRAWVHSMGCVPLPGLTASQQLQARGGEPYMRDLACYGQVGTAGCEASEVNSLVIEFQGSGQFSASSAHKTFPLVARADAASIVLNVCAESGCDSGETLLICVDLQNDIAEIITTSSMMSHTTGLPPVYTADPSPSPTTMSPTTGNPTTGNPTTSEPTPAPTTSEPTPAPTSPPGTSGPTPAPSTAGPTLSPSRQPTTGNPTPAPSGSPVTTAPSGSPVTKVAASLSPHQSPTSAPSLGISADVQEPNDRLDTGDGGGNQAAVGGKTPGQRHHPCPALVAQFRELLRKRRQTGKKNEHYRGQHDMQLQEIMLSADESGCCLDQVPPQGLVAFGIAEANGTTRSVAISMSIIAAVTGAVFIMAGAVFAVYRRVGAHGPDYSLLDAGYAIPDPVLGPEADPDSDTASILNHIECADSPGRRGRNQLTPTKNSMRLD